MTKKEKKPVLGLPDARLASADEPSTFIPSSLVLALYQVHFEEPSKRTAVTDEMKGWLSTELVAVGWKQVIWTGNQAMATIIPRNDTMNVDLESIQEALASDKPEKEADTSTPGILSSSGSNMKSPVDYDSVLLQEARRVFGKP
jgi:hypothetical protein